MAFYLKRAFGHTNMYLGKMRVGADRNVRIFNGVRLVMEGDAAQVDHLILHRNGFIVVESKSVTAQIEINGRGEWARVYQGRKEGIPSPVLQAERQAKFVKRYLEKHVEHLLDKMLGSVQKHFGYFFTDVLVAISDDGLIKRSGFAETDKVYKADQIPEQITLLEERYRAANRPLSFNLKDTGLSLSDKEFARVTALLRNHHRPLELNETSPQAPLPPLKRAFTLAAPVAAYCCRGCKGTNLLIKYSYT